MNNYRRCEGNVACYQCKFSDMECTFEDGDKCLQLKCTNKNAWNSVPQSIQRDYVCDFYKSTWRKD